ncbi:MAG: MmgE/PrpD family protein [Proteobacteria bacterium]|nr:MmgE/PrpD family protein [Pseudomonadota bacterium]
MDSTTQRVVDFAARLSWSDLPETAVHAAKARLLDSIGVALAAFGAPPARIARSVAPHTTDAWSARIWGSGQRTTPDMAAFVNGTMVRYLDLNDAWRTLDAAHPSDNLPGILAVTEALGGSGRDFILALAISYEIQCRFTDTVPFNDAGYDQPLVGAMACALAAGKLLGLTPEQLGHAVALAVVPHLPTYQTRAGELSMWKGCAGPNGARHGIFAARLAQAGLAGPYDAFEGVFGVWKQTLGKPGTFTLPQPGKDKARALQQTNIKTYAVRDSCQLPIATAIDLRAKIGAAAIASLRVDTYKSAHLGAVADKELWRPMTRETADHSMPFSIAAALLDGDVTPATFEDGRFRDQDVIDLIAKMTIDINPEFSKQTPQIRSCRITAVGQDGKEAVALRSITLADIEAGMPDRDVEAKFERLTRPHLAQDARRKVIDGAWALDTQSDIRRVVDLTLL